MEPKGPSGHGRRRSQEFGHRRPKQSSSRTPSTTGTPPRVTEENVQYGELGAAGSPDRCPKRTSSYELDNLPEIPPDAEVDPFAPNRELYRALRGSKGDDPLDDEILWEGDFISTQREFLQKKEEEKLLERLQRRMGQVTTAPAAPTTQPTTSSSSSVPAMANVATALTAGKRLKGLLGRILTQDVGEQPGAAAAAAGVSRRDDASAVGAAGAKAAIPGAGAGGGEARAAATAAAAADATAGAVAGSRRPPAPPAGERPASAGPRPRPKGVSMDLAQQQQQQQQIGGLRPPLKAPPLELFQQQQWAEGFASPMFPIKPTTAAAAAAAAGGGDAAGPSPVPEEGSGAPELPTAATQDAGESPAAAGGGGGAAGIVPAFHLSFKPHEGNSRPIADVGGKTPRAFSPRTWFTPRGTKIGVLAAEEEPQQEEPKPEDATVDVQVVVPLPRHVTKQAPKKQTESFKRLDTEAQLVMEFDTYSKPQQWAVKVCANGNFELVAILLIFVNCITLAMFNPLAGLEEGLNATLDRIDLILNALFTAEMLLRMLSMGGPFVYLKHPWNAFDGIMVVAGYTQFIPMGEGGAGMEGVRALRALRALRPLRTITRFQSLRSIVVCFLEAVPLLVSVVVMLAFFLFLFGVAATELFGDIFHRQCVDSQGNFEPPGYSAPDEYGCGSRRCPEGYTCETLPKSVALQVAGMDNTALSIVTVFQSMTLSGWVFLMYRAMDVTNPAACAFFIAMIIFGAYFVLNLFLAVLKSRFAVAQRLFHEARKRARQERRQRRAAAMLRRAGLGAEPIEIVAQAEGEDDEEEGQKNVITWGIKMLKARAKQFMAKKLESDTLNQHLTAVSVAAAEMTPRSNLTGFDNIDDMEHGFNQPGAPSTRVTTDFPGDPPTSGAKAEFPSRPRTRTSMDAALPGNASQVEAGRLSISGAGQLNSQFSAAARFSQSAAGHLSQAVGSDAPPASSSRPLTPPTSAGDFTAKAAPQIGAVGVALNAGGGSGARRPADAPQIGAVGVPTDSGAGGQKPVDGVKRSSVAGSAEAGGLLNGDLQASNAGTQGHDKAAATTGNPPTSMRQLYRQESMGSAMSGMSGRSGKSGMSGLSGMTGLTGMTGMTGTSIVTVCLLSAEEFDETVEGLPPLKRNLLRIQYRLRLVVEAPWFRNFFLALIVLNTVALAMVWEGQSREMQAALAHVNTALTALFTVEFGLKLVGMGVWIYISDLWNVFDAAVVAVSLLELGMSSANGVDGLKSMRSLRVLKSFRVLRVVKMFRYLESLKVITGVLVSSMGSFAAIVMLLALFWMVFSIVGLHVFGGLELDVFDETANFNSLINAMVLNFNALNMENYQIYMWSVQRASNHGAVVYFFAWIVLGNYIFLTLFLAVMLEAFEKRYKVDAVKQAKKSGGLGALFGKVKAGAKRLAARAGSSSLNSRTGSMSVLSGFTGMFGGGRKGRATADNSRPGSAGSASGNQWQLDHQETFGSDSVGDTSRRTSGDSGGDEVGTAAELQQQAAKGGQLKGGLKGRGAAAVAAAAAAAGAVPVAEGRRVSWGDGFEVCPTGGTPFATGADDNPANEGDACGDDNNRRRSSDSAPGRQPQQPRMQLLRQGSCTRRCSSHEAVAAAAGLASGSHWLPPDMVFPTLVKQSRKGWWKSGSHEGMGEEGDYTWQEFFDTLQSIYLPNRAGRYSSDGGGGGSSSSSSSRRCTVSDSDPEGWLPTAAAAPPVAAVAAAGRLLGHASRSSSAARAIAEGDEGRADSSGSSFQQRGLLVAPTLHPSLLNPISGAEQGFTGGHDGSSSTRLAVAETAAAAGGQSLVFHSSYLQEGGGECVPATPMLGTDVAAPAAAAGRPWSPRTAAGTSTQPTLTTEDAEEGGAGSTTSSSSSSSRGRALLSEQDASVSNDGVAALTAVTGVSPEGGAAAEGVATEAAAAAPSPPKPQRVRHITFHVDGEEDFEQGGKSHSGDGSSLLTSNQKGGTSVPLSLQLLQAGKLPSSQHAGVTVKGIKKRRAEAEAAAAAGAALQGPLSNAPSADLSSGGALVSATSGLIFPTPDPSNPSNPGYTGGPSAAATAGTAASEGVSGGSSSSSSAAAAAAAAPGAGNAYEREGSSGLPRSNSMNRRVSRASDVGSEGGMSDTGMSVMSGDTDFTYRSSGGTRHRGKNIPPLAGKSLWVFTDTNPVRSGVYSLVANPWFDYLMFLFIVLNCVAMAYEYPDMDKKALDGIVLYWADLAFTILFTVEAALKIFAFGFKPYWSIFTNKIDLLIVISSLVMMALEGTDLAIIHSLRVLRAIKPLRALTRSAGMQLIFKSVTLSLAAMANVSMVVLMLMLIFAILGVQLFHGKFQRCNDDSVAGKVECVGSFTDPETGLDTARRWEKYPFNFDNLGNALITLFIVATLDGYEEIVRAGMDAPEEPHLQPRHFSNWSSFFYFLAYVVVVAYTLLNLYIGVVFYQFSKIRQQSQAGSAFLTSDQTEWIELSKMVFRLKPPDKTPVPDNWLRRKVYYMVIARPFESLVLVVILLNTASMAVTYYGASGVMVATMEAINYAFTCIYVIEALLKVVGLGWPNYWKNSWNKFDFLLSLTSVLDMAVSLAVGSSVKALKVQKIMRLLRLARVIKLIRGFKGVRSLFSTLLISLPAFWNVGALLMLLFYMYAYVGVLLFGKVARNRALDAHTNFERFWFAMLTLFRVATADNWADVFRGCMVKPPDCDPSLGNCGTPAAIPYFLTFVLLITIIMLNLFTAVIIESFEKQQEQEQWKLNPQSLEDFVNLWAEYDDGTGTIEPKDLEGILLRLAPPLGLGPQADGKDVLRFVFDLDIPLQQGRVPFHRTVFELVHRCSGAEIPEGVLKDQIDKLVKKHFQGLKSDEILNFSVAVTVMRVQRKWRSRIRAATLKKKQEERQARFAPPAWGAVVEGWRGIMTQAIKAREGGNLRWRPAAAHQALWAAAKGEVEAERAAALEAALARSRAAASFRNRGPIGGGYYRRADEGAGADGKGGAGEGESARWTGRGVGAWVSSLTGALQRLMSGILSRGGSTENSRRGSMNLRHSGSSSHSQKDS